MASTVISSQAACSLLSKMENSAVEINVSQQNQGDFCADLSQPPDVLAFSIETIETRKTDENREKETGF